MENGQTTILGMGGNRIQAAVAFEYKGYVISVSSIPTNIEVIVFDDVTGDCAMDYLFGSGSPLHASAENMRIIIEKIDQFESPDLPTNEGDEK